MDAFSGSLVKFCRCCCYSGRGKGAYDELSNEYLYYSTEDFSTALVSWKHLSSVICTVLQFSLGQNRYRTIGST